MRGINRTSDKRLIPLVDYKNRLKRLLGDILSVAYAKHDMLLDEISSHIGVPISTVRRWILTRGTPMRRGREKVALSIQKGRRKSLRGIKLAPFTEEHKKKISISRRRWGELHGAQYRKTSNGYIEVLRGPNAGRLLHDVLYEMHYNVKLLPTEVVHHKDGSRDNNVMENLEKMTRTQHASIHAFENLPKRKRNSLGQFI